jgi:hypothetical protein
MGQNGRTYQEHIINAFIKAIPPYPPGTNVRLLDGDEAIVTRIAHHIQRPFIRYLSSGKEISLADHTTVMIGHVEESSTN